MDSSERVSLLAHLKDQAAALSRMTDEAAALGRMADEVTASLAAEECLIAIRNQVFVIKETLGTLEVPHALASRDEWSRARGGDRGV